VFCVKCGQEIETGRSFCRFCGAPVLPDESVEEPPPYATYTVEEPSGSPPASEPRRASGSRPASEPRLWSGSRPPSGSRRPRESLIILLIAFLVVACAVAAAVTYLALRDDGRGSDGASAEIVTDPALGPDATEGGPDGTAGGPTTTADAPTTTADAPTTTADAPTTTAGGPDTSSATTVPADTTTSETPVEPADLSSLAIVSASSVLATQGEVDYDEDNLVDDDPLTCWAEGVAGYGLGEYVEFAFSSPVTITGLSIVPGYDKFVDGWDRWTSNGRVRSFTLSFSDGTSETYSVTDTRDPQAVTLSTPRTATWVRFTISGVYEAEEGPNKAEDTSVSELHFWGTG